MRTYAKAVAIAADYCTTEDFGVGTITRWIGGEPEKWEITTKEGVFEIYASIKAAIAIEEAGFDIRAI